ncbi:MAG: DUF1538 domain-containing protein [Bacteroidota bacterium]|nr:DUF1538 domain-containing protein [Kiloniellaceae bacterium]
MEALFILYHEATRTLLDLAPMIVLIALFQLGVIRRPVPHLARVLVGLLYVALGLMLFRMGLTGSLIPVGRDMARQLVNAAYADGPASGLDFLPIVAFAAVIGFTATLIEPTLISAAGRIQELSGGALRERVFRAVVAFGVALGLVLGTLRIIGGLPLDYLVAGMAACLVVLAAVSRRDIVPVALDSGGIATSIVTVPLIAAYGIAVAEAMPTEATAADGFGVIALACLSPMIMLLAFAFVQARLGRARHSGGSDAV